MLRVSILGMFVQKDMMSNDTIISLSPMETFMMYLENVVEFLAMLFSSLTFSSLRMLAMCLLRMCNSILINT